MKLFVAYCETCDSGQVSKSQRRVEALSEVHALKERQKTGQVHIVSYVELNLDEGQAHETTVVSVG